MITSLVRLSIDTNTPQTSMASESTSEWELVKKYHRFHRDEKQSSNWSNEERLARAYESKLFKEYAVIDLKHYKSKRFALRWRTASEVVDGIGEETCASLRCRYHRRDAEEAERLSLQVFEVPFVYEEQGERRECLVKVRLCSSCGDKLRWQPQEKRHREKSRRELSPKRRPANLRDRESPKREKPDVVGREGFSDERD